MRYWAYINNQVCGPVEKERLSDFATFNVSSLICPETPEGGETAAWKAASTYPEVLAVLSPAPVPARPARAAAESPLAMTMRGTLIEDTGTASPAPAASPVQARPAVESPLAMTMRGTLIEQPATGGPAAAAQEGPRAAPRNSAGPEAAQTPDPLKQKLDQISAMMASIANGQSQLLDRLGRVESAVAEMKATLPPPPPR